MPGPSYGDLNLPHRILLGPGPSNLHPRVQQAMTAPMVGHLDPEFLKVMDDTMALLRHVFGTRNHLTFPVSGTGSAGMEAALVNILEPGDVVVIGINGVFGERMVEVAQRGGATVEPVKAEWGRIVEPEAMEAALRRHPRVKALALIHAETSTGILQPLGEASRLAKEHGAFLVVDAVTSLGGYPVEVDRNGIDVAYSATQKCLSAPPGLAPITFTEAALAAVRGRKTKVQSWYFDVALLESYWSAGRVYHHTAPILMNYALREALRLVDEEGLEARYARHARNAAALRAGLEAMGLSLFAQEGHRLPMLTSVRLPQGVDDARVRAALLNEHNIEIGGGLGPTRGQIWRVGLMGESSTEENVLLFLSALEQVLAGEGFGVEPDAGVAAAREVLARQQV